MKYLKVWTDFVNVLQPLQDDEKGRLFVAMLNYAATGEEPANFAGNERFLWQVAKRDIDIAADRAETLRQNGMRGGRPKTKENQPEATETALKQPGGTLSAGYQINRIVELLKAQNETLTILSNKVAFIVDELTK